MKLKKWVSGVLCFTMLFSLQTPGLSTRVDAAPGAEKAATIGTVDLTGDQAFDSDSVMNNDDDQWRWLSYPESRMVTNYGKRSEKAKYDGGMNLNVAFAVNGFQTKDSMHKIQMGPKGGAVSDYQTLKTAWYPYKLTADATYSKGSLHMDEFFADKNTFVRLISVKDAAEAQLKMSAKISGISLQEDGTLLVEQKDYWLVYKLMLLNDTTNVSKLLKPVVNGEDWSVLIPFDTDTANVAFSMTLLPKNAGSNSASKALELAGETMKVGNRLSDKLQATKTFWDGKLAKVPAPTVWGVTGNASNASVSAEKHRRSFYAAWAFQYQNIVEPTPEKGYPYYQVTLGKASTWAHGAASAPNSCSWESFFNIQELSLVEPEIAWDAVKGFIYNIDENGILDGECLPSQKAHTVWVCYSNLLQKGIDKKDELEDLYPYIRRYLLWRAENPRWIYGSQNFSDEKDISFVTQWFSDVNYAVKICEALGKYDDIAMYENLKTQMGENSRDWFFQEYDYATGTGRIMAFRFLNQTGENRYKYSSHDSYQPDALNYVYSSLFADFPKDLTDMLVQSYLNFRNNDAPLLGFDFFKYGDGVHTAYGLMEKELKYPQLKGEWKKFVSAVLCNVVKNVDFAECLRVSGGSAKLEGVEPSSFNATAMIDYTYMLNGLRIDMGELTAIGDATVQKTQNTDVTVYTIKGTKPELPKTVTVANGKGEAMDALAIWPEIPEASYSGEEAQSEFKVEGSIYGTELKVTATVKVYKEDVTIQPVKDSVLAGKVPALPETVAATYDKDGITHNCVVKIKWNELKSEDFAAAGIVKVGGRIEFNQQAVEAQVNVLNGPVIQAADTMEQYQSTKLSVVNQDDTEQEYTNVQWSISNGGYDAVAGISQDGTLLAVKPGEVTVNATVKDANGSSFTASKTIHISEKKVTTFSYGAKVTASNYADDASTPEKAIDENELTWWRGANNDANQWFQIEMKQTIPVNGMKIRWYEGNQPKAIQLLTSEDGVSWNSVYTRSSGISSGRENYSEIIVLNQSVKAKYVKLVSSQAGDNKTGIIEFQVFGSPEITTSASDIAITSGTGDFTITEKGALLQLYANVVPNDVSDGRVVWSLTDINGNATDIAAITPYGAVNPMKNGTVIAVATAADGSGVRASQTITIINQDLVNVALNKSASATTNSSDAYKATDGSLATRWGSAKNAPQNSSFTVDLKGKYEISSIALYFESALPVDFILQYSKDGTVWKEIKQVSGNKEQNLRYTFEPVKADYLRLQALKTTNQEWGFSVWEFEAYGQLFIINKNALQSLYDEVRDLKEEEYTAQSYGSFKIFLAAAEAVLKDEDASQAAVDKAQGDLKSAMDGLVKITGEVSAVIAPANLFFDRNPEKQADASTAITWNDAAKITDIRNAESSIDPANYAVSDSTLTIKKEYLAGLAAGDYTFHVEFDKGNAAALYISVTDTTETAPGSAVLSPASAGFDKNPEYQADVTTTIVWNDATKITDIKNAGNSIAVENYAVSGSSLTIKKEYLSQLSAGSHPLKVEFDAGDAFILLVNIADTTPAPVVSAVITPANTGFDQRYENKADINTSITWNDASVITGITLDGNILGPENYAVDGTRLTIKKEYLTGLGLGDHVLAIVFDKGNAAVLNVKIMNTTAATGSYQEPAPIVTPVKAEPQIAGSDGAAGWDAIVKNISSTEEGKQEKSQVAIDMKKETVLPKEVLSTLKGKDITLKLQMEGYNWVLNGLTITGDNLRDTDLSVTRRENVIPGETVKNTAGENSSLQLQLIHNGEFGFGATLEMNLDKKDKGLIANLFYYDPASKTLLLQGISKIDDNGNTAFAFRHASDYVIVLSKKALIEDELGKITVTPEQKTLYAGGTTGKSAAINLCLPEVIKNAIENGSVESKITYQSGNSKIAAVSDTGKITALKNGTVTVKTIVTVDGRIRTFATKVKVRKAYLETEKKAVTMKTGEKAAFSVKCFGYKKADVVYGTTKKSIVVIAGKSGIATAKSKGIDYVVIKAGDAVARVKVTVK
ncbi:Ig-like domain (group 2) [Anaerocolumna jejuensis DSM 15929]|uniref:Ig-like domain (Group 2) n=1 Tax=Anaerocolumna jejuensis DSM 15929 TaxID=1121322 RepID=A0A1M6TC41_9FIRM|nr:X2-like carbohydrate binding domain-containing protein [Anaerocolumna jejuensis]SHK54338.1 Ig-like domain (group 2) [Anaerocolumna jejuensis DSM 15929]